MKITWKKLETDANNFGSLAKKILSFSSKFYYSQKYFHASPAGHFCIIVPRRLFYTALQ
jgi:hypothetical protein